MPKRKKQKKILNDSPARWKRIEKLYGLTRSQFKRILQEQDGCCYICRRNPEQIRRRQHLSVDHDHKSGRIRGLLCFNCNRRILPSVREDPEFVKRLLEYLTRETKYGKVPNS